MSKLETVLIEHPSTPACSLRINAQDFNPDTMKYFIEHSEAPTLFETPTIPILTDWEQLLASEGWRAVKERAEDLGFEKPDDLSWSEALQQIANYEAGVRF